MDRHNFALRLVFRKILNELAKHFDEFTAAVYEIVAEHYLDQALETLCSIGLDEIHRVTHYWTFKSSKPIALIEFRLKSPWMALLKLQPANDQADLTVFYYRWGLLQVQWEGLRRQVAWLKLSSALRALAKDDPVYRNARRYYEQARELGLVPRRVELKGGEA